MKKIYYLSTCDTCKRIMKELNLPSSFIKQDIKTQGLSEQDVEEMQNLAGSYEALFSKRAQLYKQRNLKDEDLIEDDSLVVTLEAGSISSWQKYIKNKGLNLGIDQYGESAPSKEVYDHFNLTEEKIVSFIQKKLRE